MTKRTVAIIAGLAAAGAIAGAKYANRQPAVGDADTHEIEELGEGIGQMGKGVHGMGKGIHRMGKGLHRVSRGLDRMGRGLSSSFEETSRNDR